MVFFTSAHADWGREKKKNSLIPCKNIAGGFRCVKTVTGVHHWRSVLLLAAFIHSLSALIPSVLISPITLFFLCVCQRVKSSLLLSNSVTISSPDWTTERKRPPPNPELSPAASYYCNYRFFKQTMGNLCLIFQPHYLFNSLSFDSHQLSVSVTHCVRGSWDH